jgi:hypothetical protein
MKFLSSIILAASLLTSFTALAQGDQDVADARAATDRWMKLMDTEEYAAAWNSSSEGIRKDMSKFAWTTVAGGTHLILGEVKSRAFKAAQVKPGSAGKFGPVSFEYVSSYTKSASVRETVTVVHEADGVWRVSGYTFNNDKP